MRTTLNHLTALVSLMVTATSADAQVQTASPAQNWQGMYLGGHFGWGWGDSQWKSNSAGDPATSKGTLDLANGYNFAGGTGSYFMGLQAGYNAIVAPGILVGLQVDASAPNLVAGSARTVSATTGTAALDLKQEWTGTVRGRLGFLQGGMLFYGTAGWGWSLDRLERTHIAGGAAAAGDKQHVHVFNSGWVAGAGIEMPVGGGWTAGVEYLYADLGRQSATFLNGAQRVTADLNEQSLRVALNYHLGTNANEAAALAAPPSWFRRSDWALHGQTTYVHQYALPFKEPYRGTNSLIAKQSRETWDATAYIGYKPWNGGEIWFNPEIVQGFGLSNTLGLAGFSSGEAYKLGAAYPYARVPRFFLRQTIDLGGQSETVEAAANQFAGTRTADRLVLTIGKFSASDIFDDNKFAHDARVDFLNWSLIDTGSWDYAADAWGYTYGAAAEYVKGNWTFGAGIFDLPRFPNSTQLDTTFQQYQLIGEIERRHTIAGQPGEINLTGFLSHARMGRFDEATRIATLLASPADIASVRRMQNRTGIAASLEQNLTSDIGVFLRAGVSDGRLEPFAFTDIDRTVAAGVSIIGASWGRPRDILGIAGVVNDITGVHQRFLNAGGLGILVGDDRLARPRTERILETYYSFPVHNWRMTLDYQYVENPAYNPDRGPVSIVSTRLRSNF